MAGNTPSGSITTRIGINGLPETVQTLKSLRSTVSGLTSEWKAQETQLKSAGDYTAAAEAKYKGLSKAVEEQRTYLARLKTEQAGIDTSTSKGAESYAKLGNDISKATSKLASMSAQQSRAKDSMQYYESGIASAQNELRKISDVSDSYVKRLEAEGRTEDANKAKLSGMQSEYSKMSELYTKQSAELERIASESGKTSDAYAKQAVRVNELATKMATTKNDAKDLADEMSKSGSSSMFDRIRDSLTKTNAEGEKSKSLFKTIFSAGVISNAFTSALSSVGAGLKDAATSGFQAAQAATELTEKWQNLGISTTGVATLSATVKTLKENTQLSGQAAGDLVTRFYSTTGSTQQAEALAKGVGSITDSLKLSEQGTTSFAAGLTRIESSGRVAAAGLGRLERQAPGLGAALAKAAGMPQAQFDKLIATGKVTSTQFNGWLETASKSYDKNARDFDTSSEGAMKHLKQSWADTKQALMTPLVSVAASGLSKLSDVLNGPAMQGAVKALGNGIKDLANNAIKALGYLSDHQADINGIAKDIMKIGGELAKDLWKTISGILLDIAKAFGLVGDNAKKSGDPLKELRSALDNLAKHPQDIQKIADSIIAIGAVKGLASVAGGLLSIQKALSGMADSKMWSKISGGFKSLTDDGAGKTGLAGMASKVKGLFSGGTKAAAGAGAADLAGDAGGDLAALAPGAEVAADGAGAAGGLADAAGTVGAVATGPVGITVAAVAAVGTAATLAYKKFKPFHDAVNDVASGAAKGFSSLAEYAKKGMSDFGTAISGGVKSVQKGLSGFKNPFANMFNTKETSRNFNELIKAGNSFAKTSGGVLSKLGTSIGKTWDSAMKALGKDFNSVLKTLGPLLTALSKLWNAAWSGMEKIASAIWKVIGPAVKAGMKVVSSVISAEMKVVSAVWRGAWTVLSTTVSTIFKVISTVINTVLKALTHIIKAATDVIKGNWSGAWHQIEDVFSTIWNGIRKVVTIVMSAIGSLISKGLNAIRGVWNSVWHSISSFFGSIWNGIRKLASSAVSGVQSTISHALGSISSGWSRAWNAMASVFSKVWGGLKGIASKAMSGVKSALNIGIDAINTVWHFFSGKNALHRLATGGKITAEMRHVMVNDDNTADPRELIALPNGKMGMFEGRDVETMLPEGTHVFNSKETKEIFNNAGIQHYSLGGDIGKFLGGVADKAKEVTDWLAHPLKSVENMIDKAVSGVSGHFEELGADVMKKLAGSIANWMKSRLKSISDSLDGGGQEGNPAGKGVQRWRSDVVKALKANGLSTSEGMVNKVLRQIQTESGGNPRAVQGNIGDINNITGDLAKGLMQTISTTFNANAFPGHHNIFNGYDNLLAALRYAKKRYGSSLSYLGQGHGYANGGFADQPSVFGESGLEAAIPLSAVKSSRGYEMLGKTAAAMAARDNTQATSASDVDDRLDKLINLMTTLVDSGINETIEAHFHAYLDKTELAKEIAEPVRIENNRQNLIKSRQKGQTSW